MIIAKIMRKNYQSAGVHRTMDEINPLLCVLISDTTTSEMLKTKPGQLIVKIL